MARERDDWKKYNELQLTFQRGRDKASEGLVYCEGEPDLTGSPGDGEFSSVLGRIF